jgi:hypothetical protein
VNVASSVTSKPIPGRTKVSVDVLEKLTGVDRCLTPCRIMVWQLYTFDVGSWVKVVDNFE